MDTTSNRTFLRGDRGWGSLCGGSGGGVWWGGDVIYTSRGFAFFFCWEQVQSYYQTWTCQAQADSGPTALLGWMAESALGCSLPSAGSKGAMSPAPSATAGWRPPAWSGSPGCGRGTSWGRRVFSLGGSWLSKTSGHWPGASVQAPGPERYQVTCESLPGLGALGHPGALGPSCLAGPGGGFCPLPAILGSAHGPWGCPSALGLVSGPQPPAGGPAARPLTLEAGLQPGISHLFQGWDGGHRWLTPQWRRWQRLHPGRQARIRRFLLGQPRKWG